MKLKGPPFNDALRRATKCTAGRGMHMTLLVAIPILMTLGLPLALAACPSTEDPWEQQD